MHTAATFEFNQNSGFGFAGGGNTLFYEGAFFKKGDIKCRDKDNNLGDCPKLGSSADAGVIDGVKMEFVVQRVGKVHTITINKKVAFTWESDLAVTSIGLRPWRSRMHIYDWSIKTLNGKFGDEKCKCTPWRREGGVANPDCTSKWQEKLHCYTFPNVCPDECVDGGGKPKQCVSGSQKIPDEEPYKTTHPDLVGKFWHWSFKACEPAFDTKALVTKGTVPAGVTLHTVDDKPHDWTNGVDKFLASDCGTTDVKCKTGKYLRWDGTLGSGDFKSEMKLQMTKLAKSAATFEIKTEGDTKDSHFGFAGGCECVFGEGPMWGPFKDYGKSKDLGVIDGKAMDFIVERKGNKFTFSVNGKVIAEKTSDKTVTSIGLRPHRSQMNLYSWTVTKYGGVEDACFAKAAPLVQGGVIPGPADMCAGVTSGITTHDKCRNGVSVICNAIRDGGQSALHSAPTAPRCAALGFHSCGLHAQPSSAFHIHPSHLPRAATRHHFLPPHPGPCPLDLLTRSVLRRQSESQVRCRNGPVGTEHRLL